MLKETANRSRMTWRPFWYAVPTPSSLRAAVSWAGIHVRRVSGCWTASGGHLCWPPSPARAPCRRSGLCCASIRLHHGPTKFCSFLRDSRRDGYGGDQNVTTYAPSRSASRLPVPLPGQVCRRSRASPAEEDAQAARPHHRIPGAPSPLLAAGAGRGPPPAPAPFEHEPTATLSLGAKFYYELRVKLLLCHRKKLPPFFRVPLFI